MANDDKLVSYPDLRGSEQHHDLKNQPGEKGDKDHAETDGELSKENAKAVKSSDSDTQLADALRDVSK